MEDVAMKGRQAAGAADSHALALKLEVVAIPVADIERSKSFYTNLGWRLDADFTLSDEFRVVQFTPPGSACSIHFGKGITSASPGSAQGLYLVVSDIEIARAELMRRGVEIGALFHKEAGAATIGLDSQRRSYGSYAAFHDPDGNGWLLQEVTTRLPGRIDPGTLSFASEEELAATLRRAAAAHGEHEKQIGKSDPNWPSWYAKFMLDEQYGRLEAQ
jgi:catechol 2,3-dioxygenase-like lactoylglutathione lyase family enzyme